MKYVIFEDNKYPNLYPINLLRASFDIKAGVFSMKERIERYLPVGESVTLFVRDELAKITRSNNNNPVNQIPDEDAIFLNGRVVYSQRFLSWIINDMSMNSVLFSDDNVIAAKISADEINKRRENLKYCMDKQFFEGLKNINNTNYNFENIYELIRYPWDIIKSLDINLGFDLSFLIESVKGQARNEEVSQENENNYVSPTAKVYPGVILDTVGGEIFIDENAVVEPLVYIKGPVYIGRNALVKSGSRLYGPCSIGHSCKVSGEISGSVFHSCVNKQHDGFIGNTYACPFVNFGADTVTSNLKNNYSKVRVVLEGKSFDTGLQFLGSLIGDHTKFGINTMLNTGTICGVFSNVAGGGFPDKSISSFEWNISGKEKTLYRLDEALETAKAVMKRRGFEIKEEYKDLVKFIYERIKG
jgi:UDP-N-acetylglucosamine diphosphorylase / glucose-1-phosphate thymidylyltransferase / UDP-N-acetylgalactosamine diphosphorylase / glucosamine-1-phosphate N-acetyltransferase / galactosamine-1-phosphate N-acetyltransferase